MIPFENTAADMPDIANDTQVEVAGKLDWVGMNEIEMPVPRNPRENQQEQFLRDLELKPADYYPPDVYRDMVQTWPGVKMRLARPGDFILDVALAHIEAVTDRAPTVIFFLEHRDDDVVVADDRYRRPVHRDHHLDRHGHLNLHRRLRR